MACSHARVTAVSCASRQLLPTLSAPGLRVWVMPIVLSSFVHAGLVLSVRVPIHKSGAGEERPVSRSAPRAIPLEFVPVPLTVPAKAGGAGALPSAGARSVMVPVSALARAFVPRTLDVPLVRRDQDGLEQELSVIALQARVIDADLRPTIALPAVDDAENEGIVFEAREVDRPPIAIVRASPRVSKTLKQRVEGTSVVARFVVTAEGRVKRVRIISSPEPAINPLTIEALHAWQFIPGRKAGKAVNTWVEQELQFTRKSPFSL